MGQARQWEITGVGQLPLDLPNDVLFEILACVPILELGRLLRQKVSRRFVTAIRSVFLEMASQAVRRACELDKEGAVGDGPYKKPSKYGTLSCHRPTTIARLIRRTQPGTAIGETGRHRRKTPWRCMWIPHGRVSRPSGTLGWKEAGT
jgi:hypothetical protein